MSQIVLPFDPTGTEPSNLIEDELHAVTPPDVITDQSVVVPRYCPFFADSLIVSVGTPGSLTPLTRDVDYTLVYRHITASKATGLDVYGGILINNRVFNGNVWLQYQSIGGVLTLDDYGITENFIRSIHSVYYRSFESMVGLPAGWAVTDHPVDGENLVKMDEVNDAIRDVAAAINAANTEAGSEPIALAHQIAVSAHTPAQVGLGNVNNWSTAVANDYTVGTTNVYATALGVRNFVLGQLAGLTPDGLEDRVDALEFTTGGLVTTIDSLVIQNNGLASAINGIEDDLDDVLSQQSTNTDAINTLTGTVSNLVLDYSALSSTSSTHTSQISTINGNITTLTTANTARTLAEDAAILRGEIPNGTYEFILKPGHQKTFLVVGAGGYGGHDIDHFRDFRVPRAARGFKLYLCTDRSTGNPLAAATLIATVECGFDGEYSQSTEEYYGAGGAGGNVVLEESYVTVLQDELGTAGVNGDELNPGGTEGGEGHVISSVTYGEGVSGQQFAGAGGSGGYAEFTFNNSTSHPLKFIMNVDIHDDTLSGDHKGYVKLTHTAS